jgi:alditol oxidase
MSRLTNWAGNVTFRAATLHRPASVAGLQRLVASSDRIHALGTGHSFSPVADSPGDLVSLAGLPPVVEADTQRSQVLVSAGLRYSDIAARLQAAGLALRNLASLPQISVAGAVATGTHGSGDGSQGLAAAVSSLEMVTAAGDVLELRRSREPERLAGVVVAMGACGVVTSLTLEAVPAFDLRQWVYEGIPLAEVGRRFDEITAAAYSVSIFTDWGEARQARIWLKQLEAAPQPPADWLGGRRASTDRHPIAGLDAGNCTPQCGRTGPWHERLPHFRPQATPSAGAELQSEYLISREHAPPAIAALDAIAADLAPVTQVSEIRTVAADTEWLSPCYERPSAAFHFTWVAEPPAVLPVVAQVEAALTPFQPRPHWGKISTIPPAVVASRYPRMDDFRRLASQMDPRGVFLNQALDAYLASSR